MGFLDDMKKLLWAKKSVAKSAAKKGADEVKEITSDGYDAVKGFSEDVSDKASQTLEDVKKYMATKKESQWDPPAPEDDFVPSEDSSQPGTDEVVEPISSRMKKATEEGKKVMEQAKQKGEEVLDKAVEKSDEFWVKAEEVGKDVGAKAKDLAKDVSEKINTKMDEMLEKAEALDRKIEEEERAMDADGDGFADTPTHEKLRQQGSLLDDKDDFWAKAASFADGDYSLGKTRVVGTDDTVEPKPNDGNLKGFEDLDGDGDALMDDAIIVEDDEVIEVVSDSAEEAPKLLPPDEGEEE